MLISKAPKKQKIVKQCYKAFTMPCTFLIRKQVQYSTGKINVLVRKKLKVHAKNHRTTNGLKQFEKTIIPRLPITL